MDQAAGEGGLSETPVRESKKEPRETLRAKENAACILDGCTAPDHAGLCLGRIFESLGCLPPNGTSHWLGAAVGGVACLTAHYWEFFTQQLCLKNCAPFS